MSDVLGLRRKRADQHAAEAAKIARLERAERQLSELRRRSESAILFLTEREDRNHWREAIETMIGGRSDG